MSKASCFLLILTLLPATELAAQAKPEPIHIDAENSETDLNSGKTILTGSVYIRRGDLEIRADRAVSTPGASRVEQLELTGDPVTWNNILESGEPVDGEARTVIYNVPARTVTLRDAAVIRHPRGRVNGNRLVYDLDTGRLTGERADGENVRWLIEPEALEDAGPAADDGRDDQATGESTPAPQQDNG